MNEKTLKIYDVDALLHTECKMEAFRYQRVAVFEGNNGIVVAEREAAHQRLDGLSDVMWIPANKPARPGTMWATASFEVSLSISDIKTAPAEEMTMSAFFDRRGYNPRCQRNWKELLKSLSDIDFDLSGYLSETVPLTERIASAEEQRQNPSLSSIMQAPQHERQKDGDVK